MKARSIFLMVVSTFLLVGLVLGGCAPAAPQAEPTKAPEVSTDESTLGAGHQVAIVFASSGLGDKSFNDSLFKGAVIAQERFGISWDYVEPSAESDYEPYLRSYAQTGSYDLIISNGFSQGSSLEKVAPDFANQKFMIIDSVVDKPNVGSFVFKSEEAAYLAGIVAALVTKDTSVSHINGENKLGFVGGMDIPLIEAFAAGFKAGAKSVNPDVEVLVSYVGAWDDPAKAKELALAQFEQGADIIYQVASLGGLGVIEGASEAGYLAIGQDDNQNYLAPDNMLLSVLKMIDNTAVLAIHDVLADKWAPGVHNLGLADGGVDVTNDISNIKIADSVMAEVTKAREAIVSGSLTVPTALADVK